MQVDEYGMYPICSIYFDTDDYRLIRASLEKPVYKEKLRLRSYGAPSRMEGPVFLELKKKYKGVVYKRRVDTVSYTHLLFRVLNRQKRLMQPVKLLP